MLQSVQPLIYLELPGDKGPYSQGPGPAAGMLCSKAPCQDKSAACVSRRAKQEKRQARRQPQQLQLQQQEKAQAASVRVRSRASAARREAPKAAEEPEYKKVYKPRVRSQSQWRCRSHAWHACLATYGRADAGDGESSSKLLGPAGSLSLQLCVSELPKLQKCILQYTADLQRCSRGGT